MVIETVRDWNQKLQLPVYTRISTPKQNDYTVGEKYDIRVEDKERQSELGGKGPFRYAHECLLIAKEEYPLAEVPDELLAFDADKASKSEAVAEVMAASDYEDSDLVVVLVFLRLDKTKDWVLKEFTPIDPENGIESQEGNGLSTGTESQATQGENN